jgi:hypothetical protein
MVVRGLVIIRPAKAPMKPSERSKPAAAEPPREAKPVTREMVHARTRELAVRAGRMPLQISQADYEQARRELTGESDVGRQDAVLDAGQVANSRWPNRPSEKASNDAMFGFSPETRALRRPPEKA